jgi:hypothetical protein
MNENEKRNVDVNSQAFTRGVKAGLNSEDTKYWQAGYELGQGLSDKDTTKPVKAIDQEEPDTPLFLKDTLGGLNGDAMNEKDGSAE